MTATKVTSDRFKVSSLWPTRLREHRISVPAVLRRAGLPANKMWIALLILFVAAGLFLAGCKTTRAG